MKYARKFAREQDKKYLPQAVRQNNHELTISVMAGVLAMCFTLSPVGEASTYSRADGGPAVIKTGNTAEIYAGKLINGNAIAVNNFNKFAVSNGDIANMHFSTGAGSEVANALVNFSRNSMEINGTINAISKGGPGTGNIYFLTPAGIAVGANAMISASNIYMATPTSATMDRLLSDDNYTSTMVGWGNDLMRHSDDGSFPLNPSGTISIDTMDSFDADMTELVAPHTPIKSIGIDRTDDGEIVMTADEDGHVTVDLYAGTVLPDIDSAVNTFKTYNVASTETINMYFKSLYGSDTGIYNLINMVEDKININGVVNAVKDNLREANLYFLSPEGVSVGPDGIVNAGSAILMVPTSSEFKKLVSKNFEALSELTNNPEKIAIDPDSSITINGVVNTYNGMLLRAGKGIDLLSAEKNDKTKSTPTLNSSAAYGFNFDNMVKLTSGQILATQPNAERKLRYSPNGDIILDVTVHNGNNTSGLLKNGDSATINQEGTIDARGRVIMVADASSKDNLAAAAAPDTQAIININGKVTGSNVYASATSTNVDENNAARKMVKGIMEGLAGDKLTGGNVKFDVSKVSVKNKAQINVGKNAEITATLSTQDKGKDGKDRAITLKAKSTLKSDTSVNRKASIDNDKNKINFTGSVLEAENDAGVDVQGKLHSADGANLEAKADTNIKLAASVFSGTRKIKDGKGQPYAVSAIMLKGHNNSTVTLAEGSELKVDGGDVNVTSEATQKINSSTNALGNKEGSLSAALTYTNFSSSGKTEIGTGIETKSGNITIKGTDTILENTITTNASAGKGGDGKFRSTMDEAVLGSGNSLRNILLGWMGNDIPGADTDTLVKNVNGSIAAQRTIEANRGSVIIHKVPIKASGKITIHSGVDLQDTKFNVDGKSYNKSGKENKVKVITSGAALWSTMSNKSETIIEGADKNAQGKADEATAIRGSSISITSNTKLPESPATRFWRELQSYDPRNKEGQSTWENIKEKVMSSLPYLGSADYTKDNFEKYWGILEGKFLTLGNYANFSVRAMTDQGVNDTKTKSTGLGGSFNINSLDNTSDVIIGENRILDSKDQPLEVKSAVTGALTSLTGNPGDKLTPATSKGSMVGGSLSVQTYNNKSVTEIGRGAQLSGSKVDVSAANDTLALNLVLGSGYGQGKATINGMLGMVRGEQTAIAAVDKSAIITATDTISITADNHPIIFNGATSLMANSGSSSEKAGTAALGAAVNLIDVNTFAGTTDLAYGAEDREQNAKIKGSHAVMQDAAFEALWESLSQDEQTAITKEAKKRVEAAKKKKITLDENTEIVKIVYSRQMGDVASTTKGKLTATKIDVHAKTDGGITSLGANGAITDSGDTSSILNSFGKGMNFIPDKANKYLGQAENFMGNQVQRISTRLTNWLSDKTGFKYLKKGPAPVEMQDQGAQDAQQAQGQKGPGEGSLDLSLAGSGAINKLNENTVAVIEDADVNVKNKGDVSVRAKEDVRNLAIAGAGTLNAFNDSTQKSKTTIGGSGTLALNNNKHAVIASIHGTNIDDAGTVQSHAISEGDEMALALGADVSFNGASDVGKSFDAGGMAGINLGSRATEASIDDGSIRGMNTVVSAKATDTSRAKAIAVGVVGGKGAEIGLAGAYNAYGTGDAPNDVKASVENMNITDASKVEAIAKDKSTMYTVAAGLEGSKGGAAFSGSYGQAKSNKQVYSSVKGTNINKKNNTVDAQLINNAANDATAHTYVGAGAVSFGTARSSSLGVGASVAINTINTDTKALVEGSNLRVANNSLIKATSDADIYAKSVGVGATTEGKGAGAGSISYNNITNNVHALVTDSTMYSTGSIGVIAESNDRLDQMAGGVAGGRMISAGLSIGVNRVGGDTSALVENSDVTALGNDVVGVDASDINSTALIEGRMRNPYSDENRLKKARSNKNYRGLVVHSSGTHDVTAVQGTAGVTVSAADRSGAALVGALGFNDIQGKTSALIHNSKVNSQLVHNTAKDGTKALGNDVTVIAKDYTNNQSIAGGAAVSVGLGSSAVQGTVGGSGQNNTIGRSVSAKILGNDTGLKKDQYSIQARNLDVKATSKQHMSSVDLAAAASVNVGGKAALSGAAGMAWNTLTGDTEAGVEGAHILYTDDANVNALHEGVIYAGSGVASASVSLAGGSLGLGLATVSNTDESGTSAVVKDSILKVANGNEKSKANITAKNYSSTDNLMGAAGVAVTDPRKPLAFGAAGAMAKNRMRSTTSVVVDNSTIEAGRIKAYAENIEGIVNTMGGAGIGVGAGAGASVALNYMNDRQYAIIHGSDLHALGADNGPNDPALLVGTNVVRRTDDSTNAASVGIGAVNLNWLETKVNYEDQSDALAVDNNDKSDVAETRRKINAQNAMVGDFFGELFEGKDDEQKKAAKDKLAYGTHTIVEDSKVHADKGTTVVTATERTGYDMGGVSTGAAAGGAMGSVAKLKENHQVDVQVLNSDIVGTNTRVGAYRGNVDDKGNIIHTRQGGATAGTSVDVSWASATAEGNTGLIIKNSNIQATAGKAQVTAKDETKTKTIASGLQVIGVTMPSYNDAINENTSNVTIMIDGSSNGSSKKISGKEGLDITAEKLTQTIAEGWGYSIGLGNGIGSLAKANDTGNAAVTILGKKYTFGTDKLFTILSINKATADAKVSGEGAGVFAGVGRSKGEATVAGKAITNIDAGNTFVGTVGKIGAIVGSREDANAKADVFGGAAGAAASVAVDSATAISDTETVVNVGEQHYLNTKNDRLDSLSIVGENLSKRKATLSGHSSSASYAVGANKATTISTDRTSVVAGGGEVKYLWVTAYNASEGSADSRNVTSGTATISPYAAAAENVLKTSSVARLTGHWYVVNDIIMEAIEADQGKGHADSSNVGLMTSIGSADAKTTMGDYVDENGVSHGTLAIIDKDASIHTGTIKVRSKNILVADKTDDTQENVSTGSFGLYGHTQNASSKQYITKTSKVEVEKRADNQTSVKSRGLQLYEASTNSRVNNKAFASAGGAAAEAGVKGENIVDVTDTVNIEGKIAGSKSSEIVAAAWNDADVNLDTEAKASGAVGGAHTYNKNILRRNNHVNITGQVEDAGKLSVYVNKKADGTTSTQKLNGVSYNNDRTLGVTNKPNVDAQFVDNSSIKIAPGALINVTKTHMVLNLEEGINLNNVLDTKEWKYGMFFLGSDRVSEKSAVARSGQSSFDAYPYVPFTAKHSVDTTLGYQIGGKEVKRTALATGKDGKTVTVDLIPEKYKLGKVSVGVFN